MRPASLLALMLAACAQALAADYAREERWAQEIAPAIVVGDAVYLSTPSRPRVFAILAEPRGHAKGRRRHRSRPRRPSGLGIERRDPHEARRRGLRHAVRADAGARVRRHARRLSRDAAAKPRERIAAAIRYLREKGVAQVAIVSHSFGATMANAYLARPDAMAIDAWVAIGMFGTFDGKPKEPVLDIVAERDFDEVRAAATLRARDPPQTKCSRQMTIADTDHYFDDKQAELAAAIAAFLERVFDARC